MLYTCYLRKGIVYVPTVGRRGGAYTDIEPVTVVPVTDTVGLLRAFFDVIARGNAAVPLIKGKWPPPVVLKHARARSWAAFAREASTWNFSERQGVYQINGYKMHPDGSWIEDKEQIIKFPPDTTVDVVVDRLIAILQDAARNNTAPVIMDRPDRPVQRPPLPPGADPEWLRLPRGPERIDELADFVEWMANAKPKDEQVIRAEIKRYFYDVGDQSGAAALNGAFTALLRPNLTREARQSILDQLDVYTRTDPAEKRDRTNGAAEWTE